MRQKVDIADVEAATKIRAKYLRALENEEFGLLPGPTFTKTFLRTYADYLGLDAQLLVEEYRVQHEPRGEEVHPIGAPRGARGGRGGGRSGPRRGGGGRAPVGPPGPAAVFAGVVVLLLAVILVLGFTGENDEGGGDKPDTTAQQARDESRAQERARERRRAKRARERKRRRQEASVVRLRLAPEEPVYACVVDGSGKQLFGGTLSEAQSFRAKRIRINLGRTTVRVTVNKKALRIPASSDPVGYDLRAGRKPKELPLGQRPNC